MKEDSASRRFVDLTGEIDEANSEASSESNNESSNEFSNEFSNEEQLP